MAPPQLKTLTTSLDQAGRDLRPFIAIDQEGGAIQRLTAAKGFAGLASARKIATMDEAAAYGLYRGAARELGGPASTSISDRSSTSTSIRRAP